MSMNALLQAFMELKQSIQAFMDSKSARVVLQGAARDLRLYIAVLGGFNHS